MVHTLKVTDRSPKNVVRQLLLADKGPRNSAAMNATLDQWLSSTTQGGHKTFKSYCRAQTWTLAEVLSLLDYQCNFIFGDGMDNEEFNDLWWIFQPIVKKQGLLNITEMMTVLTGPVPTPDSSTRAAGLEV